MMPAKAATAEPIAKVVSTTKLKLMPIACAVSPSCATARIARPSLVLVITKVHDGDHRQSRQQQDHAVEAQRQMAPAQRVRGKERRKRFRVRAIREEQTHALAQHGSQ